MKNFRRLIIAIFLIGASAFFINFSVVAMNFTLGYFGLDYNTAVQVVHKNIQITQRNTLEKFSKTFSSRGYEKDSSDWNIELDYEDLKEFSKPFSIARAEERIFLSDEDKNWVKSDVTISGKRFKSAKVKISGTSNTPFNKSLSWFYRFKIWLSGVEVYDPTVVNYSYKVKLKSDKFSNGVRRFTLNTPGDQWDTSTIVLTNIAKDWGLIGSKVWPELVFINNVDAGLFLVSEDIDKELLEREYKTTNYGIYKSNDEWDKSLNKRHVSFTDYTTQDKEQGGMSPASEYGLTKLGQLFQVLENNNLKELKSRIDLDYHAKISALEMLYGNTHSTIGDNVKYIYDFSNGLIYPSFRIEGSIKEMRNFKSAKGFERSAELRHDRNRILKLLTYDTEWVKLRNSYLADLVDRKKEILSQIRLENNKLEAKSFKTSKLMSAKIIRSKKSVRIARNNLKNIKRYLRVHAKKDPIGKTKIRVSSFGNITKKELKKVKRIKDKEYKDYAKVYATVIKNSDILEVLHISATESHIEKIITCDNKEILFDKKLVLAPTLVKKELQKVQILDIGALDCIENLVISKDNKRLAQRHIHINNRIELKTISMTYEAFKETFRGASRIGSGLNEQWIIPKDIHYVNNDIILPKGIGLKILAGSKILLGPNKSILVRGNLHAIGNESNPILINKSGLENFGSFAVIGSTAPAEVILQNMQLGNGSEKIIDGIYFSSQMSLHNTISSIASSQFFGSSSDDGLNIKNSNVNLTNNSFFNNFGDQVDLDFCEGLVEENKFFMDNEINNQMSETDGLDVSGSTLLVKDNEFKNLSDKAISIGEQSKINLITNSIQSSKIGIAVKDGSSANLSDNFLDRNKIELTTYIKKLMYKEPTFLSDMSFDCENLDSEFKNQIVYKFGKNKSAASLPGEVQNLSCESLR
jgi:hypothetical protein